MMHSRRHSKNAPFALVTKRAPMFIRDGRLLSGDDRPLLALFVHQDAAGFFVLLRDGGDVDRKEFLAALVGHLLTRLGKVLGDGGGVGFLLAGDLDYYAVAAGVDSVGDLTVAEIEDLRSHLADLAEVRNLAIATDEVAGLDRGADGLGGSGKVARLLDLSSEGVGLRGE